LKKLQDRMKHDKGFKMGIDMVGFPLEYVAALTSKKNNGE